MGLVTMLHSSNRKFRFNCLLLAAIAPLSTQLAHANGLAVDTDSVTISSSAGGFSQAKSLLTTPGLIPATNSIPAASISGDLTFTFNLRAATGKTIATGSAYTFEAGMFIDDDATSRRLEISISNISITFDSNGNIVSGSVAAGNQASVSGRSADGSITANIAIPNNLLSFSDTSLFIRAGAQISQIQGSPSAILQDLTTTFSSAAAYKYGIFLKQTGGPEGVTLGLTNGTTFFGCSATNPMLLASQTNFAGAYALQGAMGIVGAAGADPTPFATGTANCTTTPALGGGGGGGSSTAAADAAATTTQTNLQNQIPTNAPPTTDLITQVNTTATTVAAQVAAGTASPSTLLTVLDTLNKSLNSQDGTTPSSSTAATLASIDTVLKAMTNVILTPTQKTDFLTKIATTITNTASNITERGAGQAGASFVSILTNLGSSIASAASVLNNNTVSNSLAEAARLASIAANVNSTSASNNGKFRLTRVLLGIALSQGTTTSPISINGTVAAGTDYLSATRVAALNGEETKVEISAGVVKSVNDSLLSAINVSGATANFDSSSSVTEIRAGNLYVPTFLVSTALIGSHIPNGFLSDANGGLIAVKDGLAGTYVPAPRDVNGLIATLEKQNIQVSIEADGSLYLVAATGEKFSGAFALESLTTGTLGAANVTFTPATGKPKDASYFIRVTYSDGSVQKLTPYVAENNFYTSLLNRNIEVTTDRATGIITGPNNVRLRPDYFVSNLTTADQTFHTANKDSDGVAYRVATDFNSDGTLDLEVIATSGKQVVYVLP